MKNKWGRVVVEALLAILILGIGQTLNDVIGNVLVIFAAIVFVHAIVEAFRKPKQTPVA
jgi:uncharacterized membrane protein